MALYSGVNGASCPNPQDLVWSNEAWPPNPRTTKRVHCPFRFGYFEKSTICALALDPASATSATAQIEMRQAIGPLRAPDASKLHCFSVPAEEERTRGESPACLASPK